MVIWSYCTNNKRRGRSSVRALRGCGANDDPTTRAQSVRVGCLHDSALRPSCRSFFLVPLLVAVREVAVVITARSTSQTGGSFVI